MRRRGNEHYGAGQQLVCYSAAWVFGRASAAMRPLRAYRHVSSRAYVSPRACVVPVPADLAALPVRGLRPAGSATRDKGPGSKSAIYRLENPALPCCETSVSSKIKLR